MSTEAPDTHTLVSIFKTMAFLKLNDDRVMQTMRAGKLFRTYYSARGQECIPAASSAILTREDYLVTTYRGLSDMLSKGIPPKLVWAELAGRVTGTCKGKGGPMHLTYPDFGCMVTTGIVGAGTPIGCGLALAAKLRGEKRVTVTNFGDGASNIGAFHESLNLAAVWKLPVVFVCSNNQYAEHTAYRKGTSIDKISDRAKAYGIEGVHVDGNDVLAVYAAAAEAIARARRGEGPTLIEAVTFRFNGHYLADTGDFIPKEQYAEAVANDPYPRFRNWLMTERKVSAAQLDAIEVEVNREIDSASEFAFASPLTDGSEVMRDVYADSVA